MRLLFAAFLIAHSACSHTPPEREALDFSSKPDTFEGGKPEELQPEKIFSWQKYYKNPPALAERKTLPAAKESTGSIEERLKNARNALAIGNRSLSKDIYAKILKDDSTQLDAHLELAHIYLAENEVERSFDYLASVKKILEKTERPAKDIVIRYRFALAQAYIKGQNRKHGHQILTDLIDTEPSFTLAYASLAQSYLELGKADLAEFIVKRGLDQDTSDPRLLNLMAVLSLKAGRQPEAKDWIKQALEKNPDYVPALVNRAQLAMQRREYVLAEIDLKKACDLEPLNPDAHIVLGQLLRQTGRMSASRASFERAIEVAPLNGLARFQLAKLLQDEFKDKATALQLYYDVLQTPDSELRNLANLQIQSIRDSRLYQ